jgi:phosphoesterase RecJ-like protein
MSAVGELVYHLVRHLLDRVPAGIATALYVAISTDTGSFRYANTSAQSLVIAGELVAAGASPGAISEMVYDTKPIAYLRLLSDALGGLKTAAGGRIAYLAVTQELLNKHGATADGLEGLVNYARMVDTAVYAILFSPGAEEEVKVSFRSKGRFRVDSVAAHFGGGGHRNAAGARVIGSMESVVDSVISYLSSALED